MKQKTNSIDFVRVYDAPIKTVWEAWADPKKASHWWGPRGFTITTHSKDLRAGGHWSYTMHGPDGTNYENKTLYHVVEPYSCLIYDHGGSDDRPPLFRVTVRFSEWGGKTKMEMSMALSTVQEAAQMNEFIKKANGYSTWDRLAEYLCKEDAGREQFVINRSFEVSIEQMFKFWTDPNLLVNWLAPTGFTMSFIDADICTGGASFYCMTNGKDLTLYGKTNYREVAMPNRIVYTQQFSDANGNVSRHPLAPTWPETMMTRVEFFQEGPEQTRVCVTWEPYQEVTPAELDAFIKARGGMTQGWTGSFNKLDEEIAKD